MLTIFTQGGISSPGAQECPQVCNTLPRSEDGQHYQYVQLMMTTWGKQKGNDQNYISEYNCNVDVYHQLTIAICSDKINCIECVKYFARFPPPNFVNIDFIRFLEAIASLEVVISLTH